MANELVWHYTYGGKGGGRIVEILRSGVLLPPCMIPGYDDRGDNSRAMQADRRLLLFSENERWEPASYRGVHVRGEVIDLFNRDAYATHGINIYRIGVRRKLLFPYKQLLRLVCMPKGMAQALDELAHECGANPYQWYGTTRPIPQEQWQSIEVLDGDTWKAGVDRKDIVPAPQLVPALRM